MARPLLPADPVVVTIRSTSVAEIRERGQALLEEHYLEVATNPDLMRLAPAWEAYSRLQDDGALVALAAVRGDELIGYSIGMVVRHLHYDLLVYQNDVLFVAAPHRKSRLGRQLIDASEAAAKDRGARAALWHAKPGSALCALLERRSRVQDIIYLQELR